MNFSVSNSLSQTSNILNLISQRQKVIGENVANMDTPGYIKKDIDFSILKISIWSNRLYLA